MPFRLKEELMPVLVGKLNDLVFYRWAITRPDAFDLARIQRRLVQIISDSLMDTVTCVSNKTLDLQLFDFFSSERKYYEKIQKKFDVTLIIQIILRTLL